MRLFVAIVFFLLANCARAQGLPGLPDLRDPLQPLQVPAPLQITTTSCPTITPGVGYQCQFTATGGVPPYRERSPSVLDAAESFAQLARSGEDGGRSAACQRMKLPGAYKNRDKRRHPMEPWLEIACPGCDWRIAAPFPTAERAYRRHLARIHDLPVVIAQKNDPQ